MKRVYFEHWGTFSNKFEIPAYAVGDLDVFTPSEIVAKCIERATGLSIGACQSQGTSLDKKGKPESHHYQLTLGSPIPKKYGGGLSVEGQIWFGVPVAQ